MAANASMALFSNEANMPANGSNDDIFPDPEDELGFIRDAEQTIKAFSNIFVEESTVRLPMTEEQFMEFNLDVTSQELKVKSKMPRCVDKHIDSSLQQYAKAVNEVTKANQQRQMNNAKVNNVE